MSEHVLGSVHGNTRLTARFETKPSSPKERGSDSRDSGGGYERWRSYEYRPETPSDTAEDVYVSVHRLAAVAWCYPDDWHVSEILADLDGRDVHHKSGVEWDNREENLEVIDHDRHSSVTMAERRAYAADAKRRVEREAQQRLDETPSCGRCADAADAVVAGDHLCLSHATERAQNQDVTVELL